MLAVASLVMGKARAVVLQLLSVLMRLNGHMVVLHFLLAVPSLDTADH